jgi:hypothetical protein
MKCKECGKKVPSRYKDDHHWFHRREHAKKLIKYTLIKQQETKE